jgi:hypothetical protein
MEETRNELPLNKNGIIATPVDRNIMWANRKRFDCGKRTSVLDISTKWSCGKSKWRRDDATTLFGPFLIMWSMTKLVS